MTDHTAPAAQWWRSVPYVMLLTKPYEHTAPSPSCFSRSRSSLSPPKNRLMRCNTVGGPLLVRLSAFSTPGGPACRNCRFVTGAMLFTNKFSAHECYNGSNSGHSTMTWCCLRLAGERGVRYAVRVFWRSSTLCCEGCADMPMPADCHRLGPRRRCWAPCSWHHTSARCAGVRWS